MEDDVRPPVVYADEEERFDYLRALPPIDRAEILSNMPTNVNNAVEENAWVQEQKRVMATRTATATIFATMTNEEIYAKMCHDNTPEERQKFLSTLQPKEKEKAKRSEPPPQIW